MASTKRPLGYCTAHLPGLLLLLLLLLLLATGLSPGLASSTPPQQQQQAPCPVLHSPALLFATTCSASASIEDNPPSSTTTTTTTTANLTSQWLHRTLCHSPPADPSTTFCTYTHPAFNHNRGISLITTPETLPLFNLAAVPAPPDADAAIPYTEPRPIPNKGIGLVSTAPLAASTVFLARRTPAIMLDDRAFAALGRARLTALLGAAVDALPAAHARAYLALDAGPSSTSSSSSGDDDDEPSRRAERAYDIFMRNNFQSPVPGAGDFHAAFTEISRLNHACRPNAEYFFDAHTLSQSVFAAESIPPGQELTITYIDPFQTHAARQATLLRNWGFTCTCAHCSAANHADSDARVTRIRALWAVLDDYHAAAASPALADELVRLYADEGLATRMVEAYYRAAIERNGAGDARGAAAMAARAVAAGEVMEAGVGVGPFVGVMREIVRDAEAHWSWRFRVRAREQGGGG